MGKTLITLASGALVFSISLAQFLSARGTFTRLEYLLPASWILLGVTILAGTLRLSYAGGALSARLRFESTRGDLRKRIWTIADLEDPQARETQAEAMIEAHYQGSLAEPLKALKVHNVLNQLMYWSFVAGMGTLIGYAIGNL
jgi:hypothetical protein